MIRGTFLVAAPDQPGLVARLAGFFFSHRLNIVESTSTTPSCPRSREHGPTTRRSSAA